ncbi:hypothetical protein PG987_007037 [Apiospora arundinis]
MNCTRRSSLIDIVDILLTTGLLLLGLSRLGDTGATSSLLLDGSLVSLAAAVVVDVGAADGSLALAAADSRLLLLGRSRSGSAVVVGGDRASFTTTTTRGSKEIIGDVLDLAPGQVKGRLGGGGVLEAEAGDIRSPVHARLEIFLFRQRNGGRG